MYSYGPPHMAKQKQDDQLEVTYSSYVKTQDVTLKTCRRRWTIGRSGERGSGISVLAARHDDDDIYIYIYIHIYITLCPYSDFFLTNLSNYQFPYFIHLYTWFTQQIIVAQHMCWFLKVSNPQCSAPSIFSTSSHKGSNNNPERITSAPRNLDRKIKDSTRKLTTVCLPYVKGLAETI